jgi:hypothetical protein
MQKHAKASSQKPSFLAQKDKRNMLSLIQKTLRKQKQKRSGRTV